MLLHFGDQDGAIVQHDVYGVVNGRKVVRRELDIEHGADNLDDSSFSGGGYCHEKTSNGGAGLGPAFGTERFEALGHIRACTRACSTFEGQRIGERVVLAFVHEPLVGPQRVP